uniref:Uncharacterized protein n=1 Tax=Trichobilharzia regenti TaxID=157069 RepID=A0AA85K188_TRIRE|nr:unnamed protein product [Trichobilharzia regenti]
MQFYVTFVAVLIIHNALGAYEDTRCKCVCLLPASVTNETKSTKKIFVKAISSEKCTCEYMLQNDKRFCPFCECKFQVRNTTTIKVVVCFILTIISALILYMLFLLLLEPLLSTRRLGHKTMVNIGMCSESHQTVSSTVEQDNIGKAGDVRSSNSWSTMNNMPVTTTSSSSSGVGDNSSFSSKAFDKAVIWNKSQLNSEQLINSNLRIITAPSSRGRVRHRTAGSLHDQQLDDSNSLHLTPIPSTSVGMSNVVNRVRDQQQRWKGNVEAQRARVFSERSLLN